MAILLIPYTLIITIPLKIIAYKTNQILNPEYSNTHVLMSYIPGIEYVTLIYNRYINKNTRDLIKQNITIWGNKKQ